MPEEPVTDWLTANADDVDLVHVHAGLVDLPAPAALVDGVRRLDKPLVVTVYDLPYPDHPHGADIAAALDVLVRAADEVTTLTVGSARQILARWGRTAHVLPHPHVVAEDALGSPRRPRRDLTVGLYAGDLSAGSPSALIDDLVHHLAGTGARLRVDVHASVMDPSDAAHAPTFADRLRDLVATGAVELRLVEPASTGAGIVAHLDSLDVCVVWDHRAHSAWVEACYDLGVRALVPTRGFQAAQRPCLAIPTYRPDGVRVALRAALTHELPPQAPATQRLDERRLVALAHRELYAAVLSSRHARTRVPAPYVPRGTLEER